MAVKHTATLDRPLVEEGLRKINQHNRKGQRDRKARQQAERGDGSAAQAVCPATRL